MGIISLRYEKPPVLKAKSSWFWAALEIPSFLRDFELATILQWLQNFHRRHPCEVGRKEIAQKELWMRKKLTITDAQSNVHSHNVDKSKPWWLHLLHLAVGFAFFFFSLGWGRLWVWLQFGTRIGTVHFFFIAKLKRFDKSCQRIGNNCPSLKPSKFTRIGTFHFFTVNSRRIGQQIGKKRQSFNTTNLDNFFCKKISWKFGIKITKDWKFSPNSQHPNFCTHCVCIWGSTKFTVFWKLLPNS